MSSAQPEQTAILTPDMKRVVREQRLGFVATVCSDGTPNLSPKGTTRVWDDEHLVFCDLMSPQTVENLRTNPADGLKPSSRGPNTRQTSQLRTPTSLVPNCRVWEGEYCHD